jgi:hypothetical protein
VLNDAVRYLPDARITEIDVAVFRAEGVPTVPQVLSAAVKALPA